MTYAVLLCVQCLTTLTVVIWSTNALTFYKEDLDGETLPFDDDVDGLIKIVWALVGLHVL